MKSAVRIEIECVVRFRFRIERKPSAGQYENVSISTFAIAFDLEFFREIGTVYFPYDFAFVFGKYKWVQFEYEHM